MMTIQYNVNGLWGARGVLPQVSQPGDSDGHTHKLAQFYLHTSMY